jgi:C-methyltransferase C-terminal domain
VIEWILRQGQELRLDTRRPYRDFEERVYMHRKNLVKLIEALTGDGKKIIGYGASRKGNLLLQFCALTRSHIPFIAEVNEEKFGCFTPGTNIPIISEVADP